MRNPLLGCFGAGAGLFVRFAGLGVSTGVSSAIVWTVIVSGSSSIGSGSGSGSIDRAFSSSFARAT